VLLWHVVFSSSIQSIGESDGLFSTDGCLTAYRLAYSQFSGNFVSQAAQMNGHGIPNDLMQNFDPIAILFFAPIMDRLVYPLLLKYHIKFPPIARISFGFIVASMSMLYAAVLQHFIYQAGSCYGYPLMCPAAINANGVAQGNNIHIVIQTPAYMLIGISENFASVTGFGVCIHEGTT
jgi:proton-dependent oligopeptide transporter, POT family